jgi:GDP-4-dehydro-6-deoxy-D-mannose reductase
MGSRPKGYRVRLLVTGLSGFVGSFIKPVIPCESLSTLGKEVDVRNLAELTSAVRSVRPEAVLHLAAQTSIPRSFKAPLETFEINFLGTYNLLSALSALDFTGRMLFVGSADIYGVVDPLLLPITEAHLPKPRSPYAVSKFAGEALCFQWSQTAKFEIVMARPFNHIGPGQDPGFVVANFAKQVIEVQRKLRPAIIEVGDLNATRDFTDVRDIVNAYILLLKHGSNGEVYNVCSGVETSIRSILDKLISLAEVDIEINIDPSRFRSAEHKRSVGSFEKINRAVGWKPTVTLDNTIRDIIRYWESRIS